MKQATQRKSKQAEIKRAQQLNDDATTGQAAQGAARPAKIDEAKTTKIETRGIDRSDHPDKVPEKITEVEYRSLQEGYDFLNAALFDGKLDDVFITYQRKAHSAGYFSPDRFSGRGNLSGQHELALNPDGFLGKTDEQIAQTLAHEMTHVWQHAYGKPSARGYHNKQWAEKMKSIGLMPSSTGMVGGKETGQRMSDYPIPGGAFEQVFDALAATGWKLSLQSAPCSGGIKAPSSKTKSSCQHCGGNAWAKPNYGMICDECLKQAVLAEPSLVDTHAVMALIKRYRLLPETEKQRQIPQAMTI